MADGSTEADALLSGLRARARAAGRAGEVSKEGARLLQRVAQLTARRAWGEATEVYERLATLAAEEGDVASEALARYGQAVALFQVPDGAGRAKESLQSATTLADAVGHHTLGAKAHHLLSALLGDAGDLPGAITHETLALERLDEAAEPKLTVDVYRTRATLHWLTADAAKAGADLEAAQRAARRLPEREASGVTFSLEADRRVLEALRHPEAFDARPFDALYEQARRAGRSDVMGDAALFRAVAALRTGKSKRALERALERAEEARRSALQARDGQRVMRYYAACLVVAAARDALQDRAGVIDALLTCKATLERELGKPAGELARAFLDLLPQHWGPAEFQAALDEYRLRARSRA
ncbi:MAG TPA: hypothetical protein VFN74_00410 [Chloroflexota bacterium]|nr:hypothetical protein [Chloroflexota bacterium]